MANVELVLRHHEARRVELISELSGGGPRAFRGQGRAGLGAFGVRRDRLAEMSASLKASHEVRIFLEFVERRQLPIDPQTVESRKSPEPDIRCVYLLEPDGPAPLSWSD